jgi:hypothetical protein
VVWVFGRFEHFSKRQIRINLFILPDDLFSLERTPILRSTTKGVLSALSIESIVLPLPCITGTTVDPSGKDS